MIDTNYPILADPTAQPFKEMILEIITRMLKGQSIKMVYDGGVAKATNGFVSFNLDAN